MHVGLQLGALALAAWPLAEAITFDCKNILVDNVEFDIGRLDGVHNVVHITDEETSNKNMTYTFNLCKALGDKSIPRDQQCPHGTRVCATERFYNKEKEETDPVIAEQWAIAGDFKMSSGEALDPVTERIASSGSNQDHEAEREGLRIFMKGGSRKEDDGSKKPQMAIFELICDRSGKESAMEIREDDEGDKEDEDDGSKGDGDNEDSQGPLRYVGYKDEVRDKTATGVLRVEWKTIYACEGEAGKHGKGDGASSSSWGFFTWFIIILFLAVAAYLIFGSWINYSRHGARGLDLLPHSDTIRDVPYILKDIGRRLVSTVQGGNRGGYNQI